MSVNPFVILGINTDADDDAINQAYLSKVRESPPDRDPQKFQAIHQAYQAIKDKRARLAHALFDIPEIDSNSIAQALQTEIKPGRPDSLLFRQMLQQCLLKEPGNRIGE
jgi:curved DNA-binding protein CbpA